MGTVGIRRAVVSMVVEEGPARQVAVWANRNDDDAQKVVSEAEKANMKKTFKSPTTAEPHLTVSSYP